MESQFSSNKGMKGRIVFMLIGSVLAVWVHSAVALSETLNQPRIFWPKNYDTNKAEQVHAVLRSDKFKYVDGMISYWEPNWSTTLVYDGDAQALSAFMGALKEVKGMKVHLTFSNDLSRETGSALRAGSWWVKYVHTTPGIITVRINLAAESLGREEFTLQLPKPQTGDR